MKWMFLVGDMFAAFRNFLRRLSGREREPVRRRT